MLPNPIATTAANAKTTPPHGVEFIKGVNGLDKVVLRDPCGSVAEVGSNIWSAALLDLLHIGIYLVSDYSFIKVCILKCIKAKKKPFAAIVGGSKVSSKIGVIESLLEKVDYLILGGGMIFIFYKAQGISVGSSLVEKDKLELATSLIAKAKAKGVSLLLPIDVIIADKFALDANNKIVPASSIPDGWMGLDIGPDSIKTFNDALDTTQTIIWNGPMGVFEFDKFAVGTEVSSWHSFLYINMFTTYIGS
ncbi:phosphoglycerate kinase, chloroplastic [Rosa chinensis]|nr:phosphoglycerate kinase, chloroplastic [Rosa chinensis]